MSATTQPRKIASYLQPHHEVRIEYPCVDLLEEDEDMIMLRPADIEHRYQPFPLAPDPAIEQNFPWMTLADTTRASCYATKTVYDPNTFPAEDDTSDREDSLAIDMDKYTGYMGRTVLEVATFVPSAGPENRPKCECGIGVRICRTTFLEREGGIVEELPHFLYESTVGAWKLTIRDPGTSLRDWQLDVHQLMHQMLPQDVRHVQLKLMAHGEDYDDVVNSKLWKPPRQMPIAHGIDKIATIMSSSELDCFNDTLDSEDRLLRCNSCLEDYEEGAASRAVLLPCSKKHSMCFSCLEQWCTQNGLDKVTCPYCRQRLTPDHLLLSVQPNYLDIDAPFSYDLRFTLHETIERKYAPLDRVPSWKDKTKILVDHDLLIDAWNIIIRQPLDKSVPWRMSLLFAPESWIFFRAFLDTVKQLHGKFIEAKELYRILRHDVLRAFGAEFVANGMEKYLCSKQQAILAKRGKVTPPRPGYDTFVRKTLNRVIQLLISRVCYDHDHRETITAANPKGWHGHGLLRYWCPEKGDIVLAQSPTEQ